MPWCAALVKVHTRTQPISRIICIFFSSAFARSDRSPTLLSIYLSIFPNPFRSLFRFRVSNILKLKPSQSRPGARGFYTACTYTPPQLRKRKKRCRFDSITANPNQTKKQGLNKYTSNYLTTLPRPYLTYILRIMLSSVSVSVPGRYGTVKLTLGRVHPSKSRP